jgi:uncharacterized protein YbcI
MKTQGEMASAICEKMGRLVRERRGRGPHEISAHLIQDLLVVRLKGILTPVEETLAGSPAEGEKLVKELHGELARTAKPFLEKIVEETTGVKTLALLHDISMATNEEVVIFVLSAVPQVRPRKND